MVKKIRLTSKDMRELDRVVGEELLREGIAPGEFDHITYMMPPYKGDEPEGEVILESWPPGIEIYPKYRTKKSILGTLKHELGHLGELKSRGWQTRLGFPELWLAEEVKVEGRASSNTVSPRRMATWAYVLAKTGIDRREAWNMVKEEVRSQGLRVKGRYSLARVERGLFGSTDFWD